MRYVITFPSVYFVMKAEKILKKAGINVRLIPTPREISSDCGMAMEVQYQKVEEIKKMLKNEGCKPEGFYEA